MSIKVALEHRTTYDFSHPVNAAPHVVRLRPAPHTRTPIEAYSLAVEPAGHFLNWQQDPFGNWMARLVFPEKVERLQITVGLVADMMAINPFDFFIDESAEHFPFSYDADLASDLAPYLRPVSDAEAADAFRRALPQPDGEITTIDFLANLNRAVYDAVCYSVRMEAGVQTPDETLDRAIGSCRDSAWLMVALLRQYGLAARFVSGYLVQLVADQKALDGPDGPTEDFTDLHAWAEVYLPGAGWVGMDPTSSLFAGEGHIPLSATPSPAAAAPITGATDPVEVEFSFSNEVRRVHEDPRVTRPYTDEQWRRVDELGEAVDRRFADAGLDLTMGGEPTFVALGTEPDADSAQWNTDADGEHKRELATRLAERLRVLYAKGGVVHRGQGKWYPGEPLPRWNIALQWRTDGETLWSDPDLLDDPWDTDGRDQATAHGAAGRLAARANALLGLPAEHLQPAYEDPLAALASEVRQPAGERPDESEDKLDAQGLGVLDAEVDEPTGWVLPIATGSEWTAPAWSFRRGRLVLSPGTSAVGLRLPLDSIAWKPPGVTEAPDLYRAGEPLQVGIPDVEVADPEGGPLTALAFEARDGVVHVFLPPTERLEDYAALLHLIHTAAADVESKVVLEGYGPPPDPRLTQLVVTPDPGVIEVNVQPTSSWTEHRDLMTTLYAEARQARLAAEKFDLDGTHTGTGGGNHLTLGGPEPEKSPLLKRPDLLVSLLTYWQRHPSLSYLFSGRFIGPTSQAPRFDEARPEATYEMEIAFAEIARLTEHADPDPPAPWLIDRALRHLLVDLTGNTHRAEFCIDKLYSPDSSRGRLGLLELRGFEMPPHEQMASVQALLVRTLLAWFAETPYTRPLVRWGTRLHEDFLTERGVRADLAEIVADLRDAGFPFEESWLDPFVEFRFPTLGKAEVPAAGVELRLRAAVEPWHVLGEEATGSGTARYVDSSIERVQISAIGLDPDRHVLTCNGCPVPLTADPRSDSPDLASAAVRFRAWQPWSALHPSIEVQSPLHFDVVDIARRTSLGGATYHVVHPGGRAYDSAPVNAAEAESRRAGRFEPRGHTAGALDVAAIRDAGRRAATTEYPHTLDLRRHPPEPGT